MAFTADLRTVLVGLRPGRHLLCRFGSSRYPMPCPSCVVEELARIELADKLGVRCFGDGWGNLDIELLMGELAMAIDPRLGDPQILQEILPSEL